MPKTVLWWVLRAGAGLGVRRISRGHPGATVLGGVLALLTGAAIGSDIDRAEAYQDRYYYGGRVYYSAPPPPPPGVYETRTIYHNPDGSITTYISRTPVPSPAPQP